MWFMFKIQRIGWRIATNVLNVEVLFSELEFTSVLVNDAELRLWSAFLGLRLSETIKT